MTHDFTCELDGFAMRGETQDDLVAQVEQHIAADHPNLAMSRDEIVAMIQKQQEEH